MDSATVRRMTKFGRKGADACNVEVCAGPSLAVAAGGLRVTDSTCL